jgi:hypothetical protein
MPLCFSIEAMRASGWSISLVSPVLFSTSDQMPSSFMPRYIRFQVGAITI